MSDNGGRRRLFLAGAGHALAGRSASMALIAAAEVAALSLWFSATAIIPTLRAEIGIDATTASLFTSAVQVGFVAGTLVSALLTLADRIEPRRLFAASCLIAAIANLGILFVDPTSATTIVLRFVTGACMAGIYPVGMKLAASWARGNMGIMLGMLVGALTLGSASPHLFNAFGGVDWRATIAVSSAAAACAAVLVAMSGVGPALGRAVRFDPRHALAVFTVPSVRLANLGYLGHMWELYAVWAWIGIFLDASLRTSMADPGSAATLASLLAFAFIGSGAVGCVVGGIIADRWGRTTVTVTALAVSGTCCLFAGWLFGASPVLLGLVCIVWGVAIVADSPQFSAAVAELADRNLVGTMLTVQTSLGFLLTLLTIHLLPWLVEIAGWGWAFAALAPGPALGVVAMWRLRHHPDAARLAGGRR